MGMDRQNIFKTTRQIGSWVRVKHGHPLKLDAFWDFFLSKWPVHQCICGLPNLKYHVLIFSAKIELSNAKTSTNHYPNGSVLNGHPTPLLPWCPSTGGMTHPSHLSVGSVLTLVSQELQSSRVHVLVLGAAQYMSYMGILSKKNQDLNSAPCESRHFFQQTWEFSLNSIKRT